MASQRIATRSGVQRGPRQSDKTHEPHKKSLKQRLQPFLSFWQKLSNDWIFNLSGLLAYNLLMSIFPILLALLGIVGFIFNAISPGSEETFANAIANALPGGAGGTGGVIVRAALDNLELQAGLLLAIGLVTSIFTGSRLFITLENCFGVIFRLRGRDVIHQNIMAIGMLLLYMALIPILFLASIAPTAILNSLQVSRGSVVNGLLLQVIGVAVAFVVALIFFAAIYVVVPNRPVRLREVWKGTLAAAGLLVLYEILFPIYQSVALRPNSYGSVAAFAIVILVFFYYFGLILLIGAEVNSWAAGQRETASDIAAILHEVQAHNTTRGAAGPTAGQPQEDLKNREGAPAMATSQRAEQHEQRDHHVTVSVEASHPDATPTATASHSPSSAAERAAPYAYAVPTTQPHRAVPPGRAATRQIRHERWQSRPDAEARRQRTMRARSVAAGAGLAATALWLDHTRRRDESR
jgi:YihY family inner membrane protein